MDCGSGPGMGSAGWMWCTEIVDLILTLKVLDGAEGGGEEARKELIMREMKWVKAGLSKLFNMYSVLEEFKQRF